MCKHGLCEDPLDDDEHEIELILTQKDVHDKVQSKEAVLLKQDSNNLTPAETHIIESNEHIKIAEGVSMPSLNDSSTFSLPDIQMPMRSDDEKFISSESSSFYFRRALVHGLMDPNINLLHTACQHRGTIRKPQMLTILHRKWIPQKMLLQWLLVCSYFVA